MTTILLDTNALIAFEDAGQHLKDSCASILRNVPSNTEFYYHPLQFKDIDRDKNEERKSLFKSRILRYKPLRQAPIFSHDYFAERGWSNNSDNDFVDNTLLACVVEPVVDYLITDDKNLIAKARKAGVEGRVFDLDSFNNLISNKPEPPDLACVNTEKCHALNISDSFFDSLREGYPDFDNWFAKKCARNQRDCWTIRDGDRLAALCIYKSEDSVIIDDEGFKPAGPILKLCTFKVDSGTFGFKMGERLLYVAFSYAKERGYNFIYLTVDESAHSQLVELMDTFGFKKYGHIQRDRVLGKYLRPQNSSENNLPKSDYVDCFYPLFKDDESVGKYLVPIQKEYHERLFPDISNFKNTLFGEQPEMYGPESNTIRKAYLCGASINNIEPGDLLLFYRSQDRHSIEVLGVVKEIQRSSNRQSIFNIVKGRTVYTIWEIDQMIASNPGGVLVICFDLIKYLDEPVSLKQLRKMGISHPQSICSISNEKYSMIMEASK